MTKQVKVPGIGTPGDLLTFPDGMSQQDMEKAIRSHPNFAKAQQAGQPQSMGQRLSDAADAVGGGVDEGLKSIGSGAVKGLTGLAGAPGLIERGVDWGLGKAQGLVTGNEPAPMKSHLFPTPEEIQGKLPAALGKDYQPPSAAGQALQTVSEFGVGALGGEAGNVLKMARGVPEAAPAITKTLVRWGLVPGGGAEVGKHVDKATGGDGTIGELVGSLIGFGGSARANKIPGLTAKALADIEKMEQVYYEATKKAGLTLKPDVLEKVSKSLESMAQKFAISKRTDPKVWSTIRDLQQRAAMHASKGGPGYLGTSKRFQASMIWGKPVPWEELKRIRQSLRDTMHKAETAQERLVAGEMLTEYNKSLKGLTSVHTMGNVDPRVALNLWHQADALHSTHMKVDTLDHLFNKAELASTGKGNFKDELRKQFMSFINNKKEMNWFSPDEQKAFRDFVKDVSPNRINNLVGRVAAHGHLSLLKAIGGASVKQISQKLLLDIPREAKDRLARNKYDILRDKLLGGTPPTQGAPPMSAYGAAASGLGAQTLPVGGSFGPKGQYRKEGSGEVVTYGGGQ